MTKKNLGLGCLLWRFYCLIWRVSFVSTAPSDVLYSFLTVPPLPPFTLVDLGLGLFRLI